MASLTPKQERFVLEYLVDLNATQAAIRAGYSERTARQTGAENLAKPVIAAAIQEAQAARAARVEITAEWVLRQLQEEATDRGEGASHAARVKALELLGKHLGMFPSRHQHTGPDGEPIRVQMAYDLSRLPDEDLAALEVILRRIADSGPDPGGEGTPPAP